MSNKLAVCMMDQCDVEGHKHLVLRSILDHRQTKEAVEKKNAIFTILAGQKRKRRTDNGWEFLIRWKNGSTDWVPLSAAKETNILELCNYAVAHKIHLKSAFDWWVPAIFKRKERFISKVN